jgi:hypothetical protein
MIAETRVYLLLKPTTWHHSARNNISKQRISFGKASRNNRKETQNRNHKPFKLFAMVAQPQAGPQQGPVMATYPLPVINPEIELDAHPRNLLRLRRSSPVLSPPGH